MEKVLIYVDNLHVLSDLSSCFASSLRTSFETPVPRACLRQASASNVSPSLLDDTGFGVVDTGIELEDLTGGVKARRSATETGRRGRREEKWKRKLKELVCREGMKFSHSIQFNAVPDWTSHYISYSNLKKLCVSCLSDLGR